MWDHTIATISFLFKLCTTSSVQWFIVADLPSVSQYVSRKYCYLQKVCAGALPTDHPGQDSCRDTRCETTLKLAGSCSIIQHCLSTSVSGGLDTKRDQAVLNTFAVSCRLTAGTTYSFGADQVLHFFTTLFQMCENKSLYERNNK